jgi:flagellar hook-basal body complex protein FliE
MTAPIGAIGAIGSVGGVSPTGALLPTPSIGELNPADAVGGIAANGTSGQDFAAKLADGLQNLSDLQAKSDDLGVKAATGTLTDVHDYMIASTEAALATQLTVAVRNKAVEAFNEIMRMQA